MKIFRSCLPLWEMSAPYFAAMYATKRRARLTAEPEVLSPPGNKSLARRGSEMSAALVVSSSCSPASMQTIIEIQEKVNATFKPRRAFRAITQFAF